MRKLRNYIADSIDEVIRKTSWPGYMELQRNAMLVLIASFIFAVLIGFVDIGFKNALEFFYTEF